MTINEHMAEFAGRRVADWEPGSPLPDPATTIARISLDYDEAQKGEWTDKLAQFLALPGSATVIGLVVGQWSDELEGESITRVVEALVAAREQLPQLTALFVGDMTYEQSEISWIGQTDVSPLLHAYPLLEHFGVRGGTNLSLGPLRHKALKSLIIEAGGLPVEVVREVLAADLPQLEHLELWLGDENYGADTTVDDLAPLLAGTLFPRLHTLGLRDSEIVDEIAIALADAPILERIRVLDLSLGTLSDAGAAALLANPLIRKLEKLDVHHHYCSDEMVHKLQALPITVDVSDAQGLDDEDRYVAVSE